MRAVLALLWAVALVLAVGDRVPTTDTDVTTTIALLLSVYPLIDAAASFVEARWINGAISAAAAVALAIATLTADAGAALLVFGAWAIVSGALQLTLAVRRHQGWPMRISGGLSTLAGLSFVAASAREEAQLAMLAGYAAVGAVLYLVSTLRARRTVAPA